MSVSAIIVTRGNVDLGPILESLPDEWEKLIWENGARCRRLEAGSIDTRDGDWRYWHGGLNDVSFDAPDLSVYGRYAAIQYASHDLIYVQDDDCIVSDPREIVGLFFDTRDCLEHGPMTRQTTASGHVVWACDQHDPKPCVMDEVVANMPPEFRAHYPDSCLVGFGACFYRDLPARAFRSYFEADDWETGIEVQDLFLRTADVVFTTLTPRVLVDVPVEVLPYAHDSNRMWKQPDHYGERTRVLEMARKVRDA